MPQDLLIPIAFPHRTNPDPVRAANREHCWGMTYGVSEDQARWQKLTAAQPAKVTVYTHPDAYAHDLDLVVDMNCWFFYLDSLIDDLYFDRPPEAARLIGEIVEQMEPVRTVNRSAPEVAAFGDMWEASLEGMSWHWRSRTADAWTRYLWANLAEVSDRRRGTVPRTLEAYLRIRRASVGVSPSLAMVERAARFEIPAPAYYQPDIQRLDTLACEICALCNDIASLEKEEAQGDSYNAVIILHRFEGLTREQALDRVIEMVEDRAEEFHLVSFGIPDLCDALDLSAEDRISVTRWVDGARTFIGGNLDWQREAPRYSSARPPAEQTSVTPIGKRTFTDTLAWHSSPFAGVAGDFRIPALLPIGEEHVTGTQFREPQSAG